MEHREAVLLQNALCYEEGHSRRTQHILKVYALAALLAEQENLPREQRRVLGAAAILHDIAIRYCKEHCGGDACQENQQRWAPVLVRQFLQEAGYPDSDAPEVVDLVQHHHEYTRPKPLLQLLVEADLLVNCYETQPDASARRSIEGRFHTRTGIELFRAYKKTADSF